MKNIMLRKGESSVAKVTFFSNIYKGRVAIGLLWRSEERVRKKPVVVLFPGSETSLARAIARTSMTFPFLDQDRISLGPSIETSILLPR